MKRLIKKIVKNILGYRCRQWLSFCRLYFCRKSLSLWECIARLHIYYDKQPGTVESAKLFKKILYHSKVMTQHGYLYPFDPLKVRVLPIGTTSLASITPDYATILKSDLKKIAYSFSSSDSEFYKSQEEIISAIEVKANLIADAKYSNERYKQLALKMPDLLHRDCNTLDEALQKLLFYNALFWQARHYHNGLGRLDMVLYPYYKHDIDNGVLSEEQAKSLLTKFCLTLGSQTVFKSPWLIGDTGQYILLGGVDQNGKLIDNELTRLFLEIFTELKVPDPKLIIRVNEHTSDETWKTALKCVMNGCGSPLFMNESLVMDNMVKFGYDKEDVWNFGTSACWEPLIIGKSSDQNNPFASMLACSALNDALFSGKEYSTFDDLLADVKKGLAKEAKDKIKDIEYDYSPLMSLFMPECIEKGKDFSHKGSKYMYQGAQLLGFPNLVNSLLNIKEFVYDKKLISLADCREVIQHNYFGHEDLRQLFLNNGKFGKSDKDVVSLSECLIESLSNDLKSITANGNAVKFGLSSPNYIAQSKEFGATLDGRRAGEPFAVHISPISSSIDISEVLQFAGMLQYPANCLNGNVVDFILPSAYQKQLDKFVGILKAAFSNGVFQLQLNVLDKKTLVDAKLHPEKYPTLVVRVWGFSAYFNDLPEEYKDNLIARAELYETA